MKAKTIQRWLTLREQIAALRAEEKLLRDAIVSFAFPDPKEGVNRTILAGFALKLTHKFNREIDPATLTATMKQMPEEYRQKDALITFSPSFKLRVYRDMDEATRKIFEQTLTIKPASPELEVET